MRPVHWLVLLILVGAPGGLYAQSEVPAGLKPMAGWVPRPLSAELAFRPNASADSTAHQPFWRPRPGEHLAYWVGFGAGVAVSPLLWCDDCSTVNNALTTLLLGIGGSVTALLLQRTF
jgi:hypothetical protein